MSKPLTDEQWRIINYLNFKMQCAADQYDVGVGLDYDAVVRHRDTLLSLQEPKLEELKGIMPQVPTYAKKVRPKVTHKNDGTLSSFGAAWFKLLKEHKQPATFNGVLKIITGYKEPNPGSPQQVKDWLYTLGWVPKTFDYKRNDEGVRMIPQVRDNGELCSSVTRLIKDEPSVGVLEGLTIIQHRLGVFQGFLDKAKQREDGSWYVTAEVGGLTNTLRFKHRKPIANLPKVGVPWGKEIRDCLISQEGEVFVGSDVSSLESCTKRHYMKPIDPEYVKEMSIEGYDEHLNLAVFAGAISQEDYDMYITCTDESTEDFKRVKAKRGPYKATNYSAIYGIGKEALARDLGIGVQQAEKLLGDYWERNKAVRTVIDQQVVKKALGSLWLYNPVSRFWISLRAEKDIFSSLNQSTGVFVFDNWVLFTKERGERIALQYHDEQLIATKDPEKSKANLDWAMDKTNEKLQLNVPIGIDSQIGTCYGAVH
jgi:hypothetical protein